MCFWCNVFSDLWFNTQHFPGCFDVCCVMWDVMFVASTTKQQPHALFMQCLCDGFVDVATLTISGGSQTNPSPPSCVNQPPHTEVIWIYCDVSFVLSLWCLATARWFCDGFLPAGSTESRRIEESCADDICVICASVFVHRVCIESMAFKSASSMVVVVDWFCDLWCWCPPGIVFLAASIGQISHQPWDILRFVVCFDVIFIWFDAVGFSVAESDGVYVLCGAVSSMGYW